MRESAIGRKDWTHWTLRIAVVAAASVAAGAIGIGGADAAAQPRSTVGDVADVQATIQAEVDGAIAEATSDVAGAQEVAAAPASVAQPPATPPPDATIEVSTGAAPTAAAPATDAGAQRIETASVQAPPVVVQVPAIGGETGVVVSTDPTTAAAKPLPPLRFSPRGQPRRARSDKARTRGKAHTTVRARTVVRTFTSGGSGGTSVVHSVARASVSVRTSSRTVQTRGRVRPKPAPARPRPFLPSLPGLPGPGASTSGGQASGHGTSVTFLLAALGALAVLIPLLLAKVLWSGLRMRRLVALPPWRPG